MLLQVTNNCEHFARECKTGLKTSPQVGGSGMGCGGVGVGMGVWV